MAGKEEKKGEEGGKGEETYHPVVFLRPLPLDCLPLVKVRTGGMLPGHQELKRSEQQTSSFILG